jgi:hypothetical protein
MGYENRRYLAHTGFSTVSPGNDLGNGNSSFVRDRMILYHLF